jgi:hypothetical protein
MFMIGDYVSLPHSIQLGYITDFDHVNNRYTIFHGPGLTSTTTPNMMEFDILSPISIGNRVRLINPRSLSLAGRGTVASINSVNSAVYQVNYGAGVILTSLRSELVVVNESVASAAANQLQYLLTLTNSTVPSTSYLLPISGSFPISAPVAAPEKKPPTRLVWHTSEHHKTLNDYLKD